MNNKISTLVIIISIVGTVLIVLTDCSSADSFNIELRDNDDNNLSDPLFSNVIFYFDTYSDSHGTVYKMKAMQTIELVPSKMMITSNEGLFEVSVNMEGLEGYLASSGLRFTLSSTDETFHADLKSSNNFACTFKDESNNVARFSPNIGYVLGASTLDNVDTPIAPNTITGITITFRANVTDGFHQVTFISQTSTNDREIIESYTVPDNYKIEEVPTVTRSGYIFKGWFTLDKEKIEPGFVVTSEMTDIIAYAEWDEIPASDSGGGGDQFPYLIMAIIAGCIIGTLLIVFLFRKRRGIKDGLQ